LVIPKHQIPIELPSSMVEQITQHQHDIGNVKFEMVPIHQKHHDEQTTNVYAMDLGWES